jgi:hypothetical protein
LLTVAGLHVPVIPFVDVAGRTGAADPLQIAVTGANAGTAGWLTVTLSVVIVAHCPVAGVNVYVAVIVLLTVEGLHVPVIPFVDVAGRTGGVDPLQIAVTGANVGTAGWLTVTVRVVVFAHCPVAGVNVYVPDAVLLTIAGFHVPVIPFVDVVGSTGDADPLQMAVTGANVGVAGAITVTFSVVIAAHCPDEGVNV